MRWGDYRRAPALCTSCLSCAFDARRAGGRTHKGGGLSVAPCTEPVIRRHAASKWDASAKRREEAHGTRKPINSRHAIKVNQCAPLIFVPVSPSIGSDAFCADGTSAKSDSNENSIIYCHCTCFTHSRRKQMFYFIFADFFLFFKWKFHFDWWLRTFYRQLIFHSNFYCPLLNFWLSDASFNGRPCPSIMFALSLGRCRLLRVRLIEWTALVLLVRARQAFWGAVVHDTTKLSSILFLHLICPVVRLVIFTTVVQ